MKGTKDVKKKEITARVKMMLAAPATPAPPVGSVLGQKGVAIKAFCDQFNEAYKKLNLPAGTVVTAKINVYTDKSFDFIIKLSPTSVLIKQMMKLNKASKAPGTQSAGRISKEIVQEIAQVKMHDMGGISLASAILSVEGTARSMGIEVEKK